MLFIVLCNHSLRLWKSQYVQQARSVKNEENIYWADVYVSFDFNVISDVYRSCT